MVVMVSAVIATMAEDRVVAMVVATAAAINNITNITNINSRRLLVHQ